MSATRASSNPSTELAKLLRANADRHHLWDVFGDFVEMAALAVRNAFERLGAGFDEREQRYLRIAGKYRADELERFSHAFAALVEAMEMKPGDVLGSLFGEMELGNSARGQFFTPYELCRLMASMTIDDTLRAEIDRKGFITVQEPACGAGAMLIALATQLQDQGINYQQCIHVTATDIDARAVHMTYLQLSLLHVPALVILGNTLSLEVRELWPTPAHIIGLWDHRLRRCYALGSQMEESDEHETPAPALIPAQVGQLNLFGCEVAA
jgi:hypothetical protein